MFTTQGFELFDWQRAAVDAWLQGADGMVGRGNLEVVTGGGKTLIALESASRIAETVPEVKLAVVVPTQALARQWVETIANRTTIPRERIGQLGAGRRDSFKDKTALVAVLNTAAKMLPEIAEDAQPLVLIVDEAHRAGAPKLSRVLATRAAYRMGLSATPDREEFGEDGEPLAFDEQLVGQSLGPVVYRFGLREARIAGWLPDYSLSHHSVTLRSDERVRYEALSRQVDDAQDEIRDLGGDTQRARLLSQREDELGVVARQWVALTSQRKDLLYRATERHRIAILIVLQAFGLVTGERLPRVILFHERVREAEQLREELAQFMPEITVALEHSGLPDRVRRDALAKFASGEAPVLVSVKSLIEGIDVPAADTGISVASAASVRQRVQSLGRVLRRSTDGSTKKSSMHLIFIGETVDDLIYGKTDWSDLTGELANSYWHWPLGGNQPDPLTGPPRLPLPTEDDAWIAISGQTLPTVWPGEVTGQEYSVDSNGVVHNMFGKLISNPQSIADMVGDFRDGRGGRFTVTPLHRLVVVWEVRSPKPTPWVVGKLIEPFSVAAEVVSDAIGESPVDLGALTPGSEYRGPTNKENGSFRISQRAHGTIERAVQGGREFASTLGSSNQAMNARSTIEAWIGLGMPTSKFYVNELGHAWYEAKGGRFFLAHVPGGYRWPDN